MRAAFFVCTTMKPPVSVFVLMAATVANCSFIRQSDLPHDKWVSLQRNVEFLPALDESFERQRQLRRLRSNRNYSPYSVHPFVEGESDYDEYQQAWRYLGFMIDCNDGGDDDDGGSWDGGTGEECHRYLVWAAVRLHPSLLRFQLLRLETHDCDSTLIWTMKEVELVNTSSGIERSKGGTQLPASMAGNITVAIATKTMTVNQDVPRWIAIWKILIGHYWGYSSTNLMVIGWNNCSNMRGFVSGPTRNMNS